MFDFTLHTTSPFGFVILCFFLALALSFLLYQKSIFRRNASFFSFPNILLFILRFVFLFLLSFFLLSPLITRYFKNKEKPLILFALDNSQSLVNNADSGYYKKDFVENMQEFIQSMESGFEVHSCLFGREIKKGKTPDFSETRTDISQVLAYTHDQYFNRNLAAVVLATDGIYNLGKNPRYESKRIQADIFCLALGDTSLKRDLKIRNIQKNPFAYAGNDFQILAEIQADKCRGRESILRVFMDDKEVHKQKLEFHSTTYRENIKIQLDAGQKGMKKIKISLDPVVHESNLINNTAVFILEVLENKKNILILYNSPHPDLGAIKRVFQDNENYFVDIQKCKDFVQSNKTLQELEKKYDLMILHQVPGTESLYPNQIKEWIDSQIPLLFVLGTQSNYLHFNNLKTGLIIAHKANTFNRVQAVHNPLFSYFNMDKNDWKLIEEFPPLKAAFGKYVPEQAGQMALSQRIGSIDSKLPLFIFMEKDQKRIAFLCGEGIWRWPLYEYRKNQSQYVFNSLIIKSIQFLSIKKDRRYFRLRNNKNLYYDDEAVEFEIDLYNKSYEFYKGAKIRSTIKDGQGNEKEYLMMEGENSYHLDAGYFKEGMYQYRITTEANDEKYSISGTFTVERSILELAENQANHQLLFHVSGGKQEHIFYPIQWKELRKAILEKDYKPIVYYDEEKRELIEIRYFLILFILFIGIEWFIRKFHGSY